MFLGPINVRASNEEVQLKVKEEYNSYRVCFFYLSLSLPFHSQPHDWLVFHFLVGIGDLNCLVTCASSASCKLGFFFLFLLQVLVSPFGFFLASEKQCRHNNSKFSLGVLALIWAGNSPLVSAILDLIDGEWILQLWSSIMR